MDRSESSRTTREKPPIARKPAINFKISFTKSEKLFFCTRDCINREGPSDKFSRRRCESLQAVGEGDFTGCSGDSSNSDLLNQVNKMSLGVFSPSESNSNTLSTENAAFSEPDEDYRQEVEQTKDEHPPDITPNSVTSLDNVDPDGKIFSVEIDRFQESDEKVLGPTSASPGDPGHFIKDFSDERLPSNLVELPHLQQPSEDLEGNLSINSFGNEEPLNSDDAVRKVVSSSIPDIISDHIISKASTPTDPDKNSNNPTPALVSLNSQNNASPEIETESNEASGAQNQSHPNEPAAANGDDGGDDDSDHELDDLNSRRAILRGHSIRISRSAAHRGILGDLSRLPTVAVVHSSSDSPLGSISSPSTSSLSSSSIQSRQFQSHLPKGWESRIDVHGRVFYIDHINRCTTWKKPEVTQAIPQRSSVISEEDRRIMDRRYQSLRRSLATSGASNDVAAVPEESDPISEQDGAQASSSNNQEAAGEAEAERYDENGDPVLPGAVFLCRPDFFTLLQNNQVANEEYNRNSSLKHMVNKVRRDYSSFKELQHRKDLVAFVNHFAEPNRPLPSRWEVRMDKMNKPYFVDHNLRVTTFVDPRLPPLPRFHADILRGPNRSVLSTVQENAEGRVDYHERLVSFLRQQDILDILKVKYPAIMASMSLKNKVNMIRSEGQQGILKLKDDLELTMMLSLFEEEIMSFAAGPSSAPELPFASTKQHPLQGHHRSPQKRKNLDLKLNEFYGRLEDRGFSKANIKYRLIVRRDRILQDGYDKIMSLTKKDLQRSKLVIAFKGEDGLDYGGPSREFFFLLSRELFNPYYGLFSYSANDTYTVQVSPNSGQIENYLGWFRFSGRVIALALVHQYLLDVFFTRVFYKQLLHLKPCLSDLESLDLEFYRSLVWINDKASTEELDSMCLTFSVTEEVEEDYFQSKDSDDDMAEFRSRKGFLGWFDGLVKGKGYFDQGSRRSKSSPRSQRLVASSALNVSGASNGEFDNPQPPERRISTNVEPTRSSGSETFSGLGGAFARGTNADSLAASGSKSTEHLSNGIETEAAFSPSAHRVPRIIERELKYNGRNVAVTEKNKKEYVEKMINWRVNRGTHKQMEALIFGFNEILEPKLLSRFDAQELELVIAGSLEIDIQDWRVNTSYRSGYTDNHQVITWFWNVVTSYDNNQRLRLLQFVTGTSSIPVEGFSALRGSNGPKKFCIEKWGKVTDLPRAHTCFNRLDLPPYTSYGTMLEKLTIAIEETSTFGIE